MPTSVSACSTFAGASLPALLQRFLGGVRSTEEAVQHLRQAARLGHFTAELAKAFLLRLYVEVQWYEEAQALGKELLAAFPENGVLALLVGRSQCAAARYAACAQTLGALVERLEAAGTRLARREHRFALYYFWGRALYETQQLALAFDALRRAINEDPFLQYDETLWATYYLARLYEQRGETKTALQMYRTLLRRRNVEDLHEQVEQCLRRLRHAG
ncbi:MAG: hypothetical protein KatS3mg131_3235 [Candidatus Tectimicrobiota bacterium]|nr:MAG: hypothetical protein KatS3mg131_3235 [Candidatus Tectomicrobia bacterium]